LLASAAKSAQEGRAKKSATVDVFTPASAVLFFCFSKTDKHHVALAAAGGGFRGGDATTDEREEEEGGGSTRRGVATHLITQSKQVQREINSLGKKNQKDQKRK
jgi:hypothetical protein